MSNQTALKINQMADIIIDEAIEASLNGDVDRHSIAERFIELLDNDHKSRLLVTASREYIDKRMRYRKRAVKPDTAHLQLVAVMDGTGARWARTLIRWTVFELLAKAEYYDGQAKAHQISGDQYRQLAQVCMDRGVERPEDLPDCEEVIAQIFNPADLDDGDREA